MEGDERPNAVISVIKAEPLSGMEDEASHTHGDARGEQD